VLTARMTAPTAVTTDKVSWTDTKEIGRGHRMVPPYLFPASTKLAPADWVNRPLISLIVIL
jgi:hypothetical protein